MKRTVLLFVIFLQCLSGYCQKGNKDQFIVYFNKNVPAKTKKIQLEQYIKKNEASLLSNANYENQSVFLIRVSSIRAKEITPCISDCLSLNLENEDPCCMLTIPNEAVMTLKEPCVHCGPRCCLGSSSKEVHFYDPNPITLHDLYKKTQQSLENKVSRIILGINVNNKNRDFIKNFFYNIASQPNAKNTTIVRIMVK